MLGIALAQVVSSMAQAQTCGTQESDQGGRFGPHISLEDEIRALFIFARFPDGDDGTPCDSAVWPNADVVPAWADSLFEDAAPWDTVGSLTHFTDLVSDGKHVIRGRIYPEVVVLDTTIAYYDSVYTHPTLQANQEVFEKVLLDLGSDIMDYDLNEDSWLDYAFIFYRSGVSTTSPYKMWGDWNAISWFTPDEVVYSVGGTDTLRVDQHTGATLYPYRISNGKVRHRRYCFEHSLHEYGHDLFALTSGAPYTLNGDHTKAIGPYGMMDGTYYGFTFFSAAGLDKMGWIDPIVIDSTVVDTTLVLPAVPDPASYVKVLTHDPTQYYYLEYRNDDSEYVRNPQGKVGCASVVVDYTGLLITRVAEGGKSNWDSTLAAELSPETAGGRYRVDGSPDPDDGENLMQAYWDDIYYGNGFTHRPDDLFRPGTNSVFAPYTNPRTDICSRDGFDPPRPYDDFDIYTGLTIETVEYRGGNDSLVVRIRYSGSAAPTGSDSLPGNTTWDGRVQLTADLLVGAQDTLTIAAGSEVIASAGRDRLGSDSLVTLDVQGTLIVDGIAQDAVRFTSSRDEDFDHFRGPGEPNTDPGAGDWYGIVLDASSDHEVSYPEIRYPRFGVTVDSLAGDLILPEFDSAESADVFIDRDLRIVDGVLWKLAGPTRVVVDTLDAGYGGSGGGGDTSRVEILVQGRLETTGSASDSVTITTTAEDGVNGDDWVGMTFGGTGVADLSFLEIGYADYPLAFMDCDTARVRHSKVHAFSADGILDYGSDASIDTCHVVRGTDLDFRVSTTGIHLASKGSQVVGTTVGEQNDYGIWIDLSKSYCEIDSIYPAPDADTLRITSCAVDGDLEAAATTSGGVGVYASWVCHEVRVELEENEIRDWSGGISHLMGSGLALDRASDVSVVCNLIELNKEGLYYRRDGSKLPPGEEAVWLKQNRLLRNTYANILGKVGTEGLDLTSDNVAGENTFRVYFPPPIKGNIRLFDVSTSDTLDVSGQHWRRNNDSTYTTTASVDSTFNPGSGTILIADLLETDSSCDPGQAALRGGAQTAYDSERPARVQRREVGVLDGVAVPRPNPAVGHVQIDFGVSGYVHDLHLAVYDVAGRRVRTLTRGPFGEGQHGISWDGRDQDGLVVAPGVYFVRLTTPSASQVRKVVMSR